MYNPTTARPIHWMDAYIMQSTNRHDKTEQCAYMLSDIAQVDNIHMLCISPVHTLIVFYPSYYLSAYSPLL